MSLSVKCGGGLHDEVFADGMNRYLEWLKKYGSEKQFYVVLDAPWDSAGEYDLKKQIKNRLDTGSVIKHGFYVDYPSSTKWADGNKQAERYFSDYATLITTESFVCPDKRCNLLNYKDDDHLRSSYIRNKAFWIDPIYEINYK